MPFELMDQRGVSASSHFFDETCFPTERQVGFWKTKTMPDQQVGRESRDEALPMSGRNLVTSSPLFSPIGAKSVDCLELPQSYLASDLKENLLVGLGANGNLSKSSWKSMDHGLKTCSSVCMQPASYSVGENRSGINGFQHESSLFSSSLSDIFSRKLTVSGSDQFFHPANAEEGEPFESLKEIEAQTIGNLLPDEEDLFSGVVDEPRYRAFTNGSDDLEDFDLFSSGGGMELEGNDRFSVGRRNSEFVHGVSNGQVVSNGSIVGEHPYGEYPSRTLFVRNINSNVEDSELKDIFEQFGDIRTLYTACKHRGFVMISYYDLRAAQNAMRSLQDKPLRRRKLDIHYSIPKDNPSEKDINQGTLVIYNLDSSVSNDELRQIFGACGEIKEIRETPYKRHHKFIEFYDLRAAEAALHVLNRSDIVGKQIKFVTSRAEGASCLVHQSELDQEQEKPNLSQSPCENSSSGYLVLSGSAATGLIASSCMDNGSIQGLHSAIRSPMPSFIDNAFPHPSSSFSNILPSPHDMASNGNQFGLHEPKLSLNEMNICNQQIPSLHPHSFPEYHESLANGIPYNASSSITNLVSSTGLQIAEGIDNRHIRRVNSNGHPMEPNGGVFGSSGNESNTLHGHNYTWSNPNSYQHHPSSPMMWPNSPSFANGIHTRRLPQMPGYPRAPTHMLSTGSPIHHHVGSAPVVNPSIWERQLAYTGESPEASFHLGSLGSGGYPGGSPLHHPEVASHNIFAHGGGNYMDMNKNMLSAQQMCLIYPGKNPMISMPTSFDYPNERMRNLSNRRNEANSNYGDKKQYELDIDRILRGEDSRTTLMIKNIPNKYTSKMLLAAIDENCRGTYDFIYLPIDFKNKCNVGYAFINIIDPRKIVPFYQAFNGKKWEKFNSEKVATLAYARIQGKAALITHFQNSSLMNEDKRCRPILFHTDGPNAGDQEPFPTGTNIRSRPGKPRTNGTDDNPSAFGDESTCGLDSLSGSSKDSD